MGNLCGGGGADEFTQGQVANGGDDKAQNKAANKALRERKKEMDSEIKLLLLGSGESGKSTIFKQLKKLNGTFDEKEISSYRNAIYGNILHAIQKLAESCIKEGLHFQNEEQNARAQRIIELAQDSSILINSAQKYTEEVSSDVENLWADPAMKKMFDKRYDFHIFDGASHFLAKLENLRPPYTPSFEDILKCRRKTTGMNEITFPYHGVCVKMVDVGGQRSERKKWMHCFESVSAVVFVASLADFDQKCYEDDVTNRMQESLELFDEIVNGKFFKTTTIILFLNKTDLFKQKIQTTDLSVCFDDYTGGPVYENASKFIAQKFIDCNKFDPKRIHIHYTCATDTDGIRTVFDTLKTVIVQRSLEENGML